MQCLLVRMWCLSCSCRQCQRGQCPEISKILSAHFTSFHDILGDGGVGPSSHGRLGGSSYGDPSVGACSSPMPGGAFWTCRVPGSSRGRAVLHRLCRRPGEPFSPFSACARNYLSCRFKPMQSGRHKFQGEHLWPSAWVLCCSGKQLFQEGHASLPELLVTQVVSFRLHARPVQARSSNCGAKQRSCVAVSLGTALHRRAPQAWISFVLPRLQSAQESAALCLIPTTSTVGVATLFEFRSANRMDLRPDD